MKVLVVEDEFYARKAMIRQIKKYDQDGLFEISEASNGEEGWELDRKSTRLNSSHIEESRMPSSA